MNDRIKDLKLRLQHDRRIWAVAGVITLGTVIWLLTDTDKRHPSLPQSTTQASKQGMGEIEAYQDLITSFRSKINDLSTATKEQQQIVKRIDTDFQEHKQRATGIFETLVDKLEELGRAVDRLEQNSKAGTENVSGSSDTDTSGEPDALESIGFQEATVPPPPPPPKPLRVSVISPGDSVPLQLLTGVNAPVDGTPYPVVFKLTGPISGPDGSALDVGEARLVAAAQGSETDGRALFRLTDLAIRHKDGRRSVVKVDGWVVGEDGVRGMQGKLIDKLGRLIASTAGYSFVAALGESLDDQADAVNAENTGSGDITVTSDDLSVATASALTDASNRLGQILLDRYEKLVPVVEVLSGRQVAAVFSQPAEVTVYEDDEEGLYSVSLE